MKHEENHLDGFDGTKIYYQIWSPENPKGLVLVVHGFAEHSGRYMNVVNTLVPEGYAVWGIDHRGHGKSEGKMNYVNRFTDYMDDLAILEKKAREAHPDLPVHVVGHSMGSFIANHYVGRQADPDYKSLTLSGTGAAPGPGIGGFQLFMSKLLSAILPKASIPSGLDPNFISHDEKVIEDYKNDPLVNYDKITTRLANEMMDHLSRMPDAAKNISTPCMMQIGSLDESFDRNSWDVLHASFASDDKKLNIYDGFRHECYNEVKKEEPLGDLKDWINSHN